MACKTPVLLVFSCIVMFTAMILTLTHSGYQCDIDTSEKRVTCLNYNFTTTEDSICRNSVFTITAEEGQMDIVIMCPFDFWTTFFNFVGVLSGLIFVVLTILQRMQREFSTRKFAVRFGFVSFFLLAASVIIMGVNINGGMGQCEEFENKLEENKTTQADCSVAAFAWDLALMCLGVLILGYEVYLEYRKYRFGDDEEYFKEEEATDVASDYQTRFFEDN